MGSHAMMQRDRASAALGMDVLVNEPGHAVVSMRVREDMLNGHDIAHGGLIFALADTAFAIACNDTDDVTVASGAEITFLKPTRLDQTLTATATARATFGRSGIYDVRVADENDDTVAEFRGHSRRMKGAEQ
jgi:acyl-CoA thioesterase